MANIDRFLQRNKDFAATGADEGASIIARHQVCSAGRLPADVLKDLAYIGYLLRAEMTRTILWNPA